MPRAHDALTDLKMYCDALKSKEQVNKRTSLVFIGALKIVVCTWVGVQCFVYLETFHFRPVLFGLRGTLFLIFTSSQSLTNSELNCAAGSFE